MKNNLNPPPSREQESIDLYYEDTGSGTPVVCVHGFPFDHTIWHPVASLIKDKVRFILPDLRGHGKSPAIGDVYTMQLLANDILRLIDRLSLPKIILVGQSMGGYVCFEFAHLYPERLSGLGLAATQALADSEERRQGRYETADRIRQLGMSALDGMVEKLTAHTGLYPYLHELISTNNPAGAASAQLGMAVRADARQWLPQIKVPSFVIAGHNDLFAPLESTDEMARLLPNCKQYIKLENARHMPMLESPQAVAQAILSIIE